MEVILKRDVPGLGKAGDIVKVKDGYARNYLFPKGLAVAATKSSLKEQENLTSAQRQKEERLLAEAKEYAQKLEGKTLVFRVKAGKGRIFGSVTAQEIASEIQNTYKIPVDKRRVLLDENLKELGTHEVEVQLHPKVRVRIKVEIRAEEGE
ncbi:MAG TPA: 50S ribosomal protein L9 [Firmicutes bacterium]|uniref:Large ribosomal subunit protein bL9 n=1 Tax=Candidatus Fermentithermobacillus carboniphilus TaxID=3085328 RepID=A0AAT9LAT0_9FIRM|nr:MAG: 50S ribosomal protein L9 [Candidatus Fermentithermobacillus carboniphilus]HHW19195.1 50S ribosomal protein L9 [Candidatus Fermentithermobacillaceae bacterium]